FSKVMSSMSVKSLTLSNVPLVKASQQIQQSVAFSALGIRLCYLFVGCEGLLTLILNNIGWLPWPKLDPISENVESVSADEDPNRELSEGACQEGSVASGLGAVLAVSGFAAGLGFFPSLTYTITILYDSLQLLHRPVWTTRLS